LEVSVHNLLKQLFRVLAGITAASLLQALRAVNGTDRRFSPVIDFVRYPGV
jgi:hypothetical protein